jgi:hypothetical protein
MAFNYSPKVVTDGLVLYLDAANPNSYVSGSTTWRDISRGGNNGALINGPTYSSANGGSIVFDGVDDYVTIPASSNLNIIGSITVSMFCKSNAASTTGWNMYWAGVSKYSQFILGPNGVNGKMAFIINSGGLWYPLNYVSPVWGQTNINPKEYHQYVGTYNQDTGILRLYIDGQVEVEFNVGIRTLTSDLDFFTIGKRDTPVIEVLNMSLGITQIYNRALSATEVLQNYNATKTRFGLT